MWSTPPVTATAGASPPERVAAICRRGYCTMIEALNRISKHVSAIISRELASRTTAHYRIVLGVTRHSKQTRLVRGQLRYSSLRHGRAHLSKSAKVGIQGVPHISIKAIPFLALCGLTMRLVLPPQAFFIMDVQPGLLHRPVREVNKLHFPDYISRAPSLNV